MPTFIGCPGGSQGHVTRMRPKPARCKCKACGYESHADLNAVRHLTAKGTYPLGVPDVTPGLSKEVADHSIRDGHCNL